jgi:predicted ArsR family transcriptional regulator
VPNSQQIPPQMVNDRLTTALSHDTREHALSICSVRPTSTKEIAAELGISVSAAWYHVDKLRELGCIKEVEAKPRRGALEHFYVATSDYYFDSEAWEKVPKGKRLAITMRILRLITRDVDESVRAETIYAADRHLSRTTIDLDPKGQEETYVVLAGALEGLLAVRENCAGRKGKNNGNTTLTSLVIMQLELPRRRAT